MRHYRLHKQSGRLPRRLLLILGVATAFVLVGMVVVRQVYYMNLRAVSNDTTKHYVTIASGSTVSQISNQLKEAGLIRSSQWFEAYVSSRNYREKLQAGTYSLAKSESVPTIVDKLVHGKVAADLVTILPGKRIDEVRQAFIKSGFSAAAVDEALNADTYRATYPALADNPSSSNLEGFLYPDSFQKTATTDPKIIIGASLDEMQKHLTTDIRRGFAAQGLTVYQGVILASIVEQEVPRQTDRNQAAQVFLKRLHSDMMLGSDVTARYGAVHDGLAPTLDYDSAYNTLLHKGLPPGPIGSVSDSSLVAVAHPSATDWLYFVAGDDGTTYFSKTLEEHEALTQKYCHKLCGQP